MPTIVHFYDRNRPVPDATVTGPDGEPLVSQVKLPSPFDLISELT